VAIFGELLDIFPPFLARFFHSKNREFATEYSNFKIYFAKWRTDSPPKKHFTEMPVKLQIGDRRFSLKEGR
jgi:hypothetical protein